MCDYTKVDKKIDSIIKEVSKYMKDLSFDYIKEEILKAYYYARKAHEWQFRHSKEIYIIHPVDSTIILLSLKPDIFTIQACLLHDVIEDTIKTKEDIEKLFWEEVAFLCVWMEKLSKVKYKGEQRDIWSLRKIFVAMAEDLRVIFIKLADRLHNMRTLKYHPEHRKRTKISIETLNIYAPIADRLWLYNLKNNLEEECFKILEPKDYRDLKKQLKELENNRKSFVDNVQDEIDKVLSWELFGYEIDYRVKSIYSIYNKMIRKWLKDITSLYDLFWIRIIVNDISDCYKVLWLIHNKWVPLPNRFKDYIALPKPNWYKSIHTTVIWLLKWYREQPTEIQIKTYEMKEYSDIWVAAHFEYKEKWSVIADDIDWVKELKELSQNLGDVDLIWSLKIDIFKHRIYVFTPKWDFIDLPAWSTPVDFAYYVHTDLWNHISMAKVNWNIYPLDKELHNWDVVEIIIDKNKKPNPFWISFLKTLKAKNAIKFYLKWENKELHRERWKDIMNENLSKSWLGHLNKDLSLLKVLEWKENSMENRLQILEQIWNFTTTSSSLLKKILRSNNIVLNQGNVNNDNNVLQPIVAQSIIQEENIIIGWEEYMPYKLCNCCKRKIPNEIVAYINTKWLITIHKRDCYILKWADKNRLLSAHIKWTEEDYLMFSVNLIFRNNLWILKNLSEILFSMKIDVDEIISEKLWNYKTSLSLKLLISDYDYLIIDRFIDRLKLCFNDDLIEYSVNKIK